jgi:carboxyl-terminal processing protease
MNEIIVDQDGRNKVQIQPDRGELFENRPRKRRIGLAIISVLVICILVVGSFSAGIWVDRQVMAMGSASVRVPADATQSFDLINQAWSIIREQYVDRANVANTQLAYGAISGMVDSLGDTGHSRFLSPEMVIAEQNMTSGQFEGIGVEVQSKDGHIVVVAPIDGSPAQKAGIHAGQIFIKVDGKDVTGMSLSDLVNLVLGPAGTHVNVTLMDPVSGQTQEYDLVRANIHVDSVSWRMLPGTTIAHLRVSEFSKGTTDELQKALQDIEAQGATGLILDLRNNPGGLLSEAIGVTSQFLSQGNVLLEKDAQGNITPIPVEKGGLAPDIPMVVLTNQGTASAAEILAGALQDAHRAQLVGETTFGTGTVLSEFPLSDKSALLLATVEWLTPSGRLIWHKGISPDFQVTNPPNVSSLIPDTESGLTQAGLNSSQDAQLLKALQLLTQSTSNN